MNKTQVLAVIPARGGSKGLPGKNLRSFAGLPLIAHSILLAKICPQIDRCIVTTDSLEIAAVAKRYGAEVPFLRPRELAQDETPLWPVLQHALHQVQTDWNQKFETVLLLDPTSPTRLPMDIAGAARLLQDSPEAVGVISVSRPDFNPAWHCVVEQNGWMADLMPQGVGIQRRQDAPPIYRINGLLYLWRSSFVQIQENSWRESPRHKIYEVPERRAISIDTEDEFERAELLVTGGLVQLPWLQNETVERCAP